MLPMLITAALFAAHADAPKPPTNTVCPVTGEKVTAKSGTVVVKGRTYFFCCPGCGPMMQKDPDKYFKADGTPKNAK